MYVCMKEDVIVWLFQDDAFSRFQYFERFYFFIVYIRIGLHHKTHSRAGSVPVHIKEALRRATCRQLHVCH